MQAYPASPPKRKSRASFLSLLSQAIFQNLGALPALPRKVHYVRILNLFSPSWCVNQSWHLNQILGVDPSQLCGVNTTPWKQRGRQFLPLSGRLGKACFTEDWRSSGVQRAREAVTGFSWSYCPLHDFSFSGWNPDNYGDTPWETRPPPNTILIWVVK